MDREPLRLSVHGQGQARGERVYFRQWIKQRPQQAQNLKFHRSKILGGIHELNLNWPQISIHNVLKLLLDNPICHFKV